MSLVREFKAFVARGNVVDLAVAVVLGAAFGKIVTAIVDGIIMPVVGAILPGGDWRAYSVTSLGIKIGPVLGAVVDFIIVAFVIFIVVNKLMKVIKRKDEGPEPPATKTCKECLELIPIEARRCRACTQPA
jgi:large conductance mechanosensitive channel